MTQTVTQGQRLVDKSASGHIRPWEVHKVSNELLALAYDGIDSHKAERLRGCATWLGFALKPEGDGKRLADANFCRVNLCPMCMWRRSLKIRAQISEIMEAIARDKVPVRYVYLTLTVRNCEGRNLGKALDALNDGWQRLSELKRVKDVMLGWYKAIEITHNTTYDSPDYNTFHPHIHAVLAVQPSYFGRGYIRQADWTSMWAKSMRIKYDPIVDVRRVKGATARAVAEAAGYAVKSSDYIVPEDWELTEYTVRLLDEVLHHRRLIGFGGLLREYHRKLHQDDPEDGDLIHITGDEVTKEEAELTYYAWSTGYRQYREVSKDGLMA